jgi:thiamine biosynthesis lipoprotein
VHHLIDPRTGGPSAGELRTATVAAASCAEANAAAAAVVVGGYDGLAWLLATGLPGRVVSIDGEVFTVGGWPEADGSPIPTAVNQMMTGVDTHAWGPR